MRRKQCGDGANRALGFPPALARGQLRVGNDLRYPVEGGVGDTGAVAARDDLGQGEIAKPGFDQRFERGAVGDTVGVGEEARVAGDVGR